NVIDSFYSAEPHHVHSIPTRRSSDLILYFDQTSGLPDNLLERCDRMTMAASIEARVPFLDHQLIEFVSTLPDHWRVDELRSTRVLREVARSRPARDVPERYPTAFKQF